MKKIITVACVLALVAAACSKTKGKDGGSWTFKGITYKPTFVNYVIGAFTGYTQDNLPSGSLAFTFCDSLSTIPRPTLLNGPGHAWVYPWGTIAHTGSYRVSDHNPPDSGYVYVALTDTSATRTYYSVPNSNAIVNVTVNSDSTVTQVQVTGLILKSTINASDSSTLDANMTQINY
ncbi:MAG: hypothetical protein JST76_12870 [Bacteroidetes bacterium]|nr:hypothetical protein [Bacteroidota bacterium]